VCFVLPTVIHCTEIHKIKLVTALIIATVTELYILSTCYIDVLLMITTINS